MLELSKRVRKQARELVGVAYTRELNYHLGKYWGIDWVWQDKG